MDKISASVLLKGLAPEGFADETAIDRMKSAAG